jgi:hypothetical protein
MATKKILGTKEWSTVSENIHKPPGCSNACEYCYGRADALRWKRIKNAEEWTKPCIDFEKIGHYELHGYPKKKGTIMFPSLHDIYEENLAACTGYLRMMLKSGNKVLIVSKPRLACIQHLCKELVEFKDQILFRFTIGSSLETTLKFWEPNAPGFEERFSALRYAYEAGFKTSVSAEPFLDASIMELVGIVSPYVSDFVWIGKMNKMKTRVKFRGVSYKQASEDKSLWTEDEWLYWNVVKECQTDHNIKLILYDTFKNHPKVKWKCSIKEVVGLPLATEAGKDE